MFLEISQNLQEDTCARASLPPVNTSGDCFCASFLSEDFAPNNPVLLSVPLKRHEWFEVPRCCGEYRNFFSSHSQCCGGQSELGVDANKCVCVDCLYWNCLIFNWHWFQIWSFFSCRSFKYLTRLGVVNYFGINTSS